MKWLMDMLRGVVIGVANMIPGVSGGTMMVSMGIYDTIIHCVTHLFKQFKRSILTLLPYGVGMGAAIVALSFLFNWLFDNYPLPTNTFFIGLILGGLPVIIRRMKGKKTGAVGAALLAAAFALVICLQIFGQGENVATVRLSVGEVLKLFLFGAIASATMVIPGVSGSMVLMLLGYYRPVTTAVKDLVSALTGGQWAAMGYNLGILLPFGLGVIVGIFAIAKLIEILLARWEGWTYCAILGLVLASPVAILMGTAMAGVTWVTVAISLATFAVGYWAAYALSKHQKGEQL